jgi:hypothetical protein
LVEAVDAPMPAAVTRAIAAYTLDLLHQTVFVDAAANPCRRRSKTGQ